MASYEGLAAAIAGHFSRIEAATAAAAAAAGTAAIAADTATVGNELSGSQDEAKQRQIIEQSRSLTETHLYKVEEAFLEEDRYWEENVRKVRFKSTLNDGVLYRPEIVQDLVSRLEQALTERLPEGIMVKSPHGTGKSHSLVNLVRKLVYGSSNKYLVTFIPDCEKWDSVEELLGAICDSFGYPNREDVLDRVKGNDVLDDLFLKGFIDSIDEVLKSMGKQWVFIFDQINRLFPDKFRERKDFGALDFPFFWIEPVMKRNRITSIIANTDISHKDRDEGFAKHEHSIRMTRDEICSLFPSLSEDEAADIQETTCGVPLYVKEYFLTDDTVAYEQQIENSSVDSLLSLKSADAGKWKIIQDATLSCLLALPTDAHLYDKKFFVQKRNKDGATTYEALLPQVLNASRSYLWEPLMQKVGEEEAFLLSVVRRRRLSIVLVGSISST